jgi:sugar phosphate isomerase/epimerase
MRIGLFTVLFQQLELKQMLNRARQEGISALEIGTGGYPGDHHCPLDELLTSEVRRSDYLGQIAEHELIISALSCQHEPLHPDSDLAGASDELFRKTVRLAAMLRVPVVNVLSSCPAGAPGDRCPNWVACPWPPHFKTMLDYQWNEIGIPYWRKAANFAQEHGVRIAMEMHPGMLVHNVESMLRLREAAGDALGCNFDPSHLFWNGVDPVAAIRALDDAIYHVHGKDVHIDHLNTQFHGCIDSKPYAQVRNRSWNYRTIGYGHDLKTWKNIVSALRVVEYDYVISIEHEDPLMSADEGLRKAVQALKECVVSEMPGAMYWNQ